MRGYPKHINTRRDLDVAMSIDAERTRAMLRRALDAREGWRTVAPLASESDGITDDTHRVVDQGDEETGPQWYQQEWGPLPGNMIDRLGLTVAEAEEMTG